MVSLVIELFIRKSVGWVVGFDDKVYCECFPSDVCDWGVIYLKRRDCFPCLSKPQHIEKVPV